MTERIEVVVVNPKAAEESQQAILISSLLVGGFISYWIYDALHRTRQFLAKGLKNKKAH